MSVTSRSYRVVCLVLAAMVFAVGLEVPAAAGEADPPSLPGDVGAVEAPLSTVQGVLWPSPEYIPVCWENPTEANRAGRDLAQKAVEDTWEKVSGVDFLNWGECTEFSDGIRIEVADAGARVQTLGNGLDGLEDGMRLNFTYKNWNSYCDGSKRNDCIRRNAVHEFGHALGFAHEQNRDDTPASCKDAPQGIDPDFLVTPWDSESIMNYCRPGTYEKWTLSPDDVAGVRSLYGPWDDDTPFMVAVSGSLEGTSLASASFADAVQATTPFRTAFR